VREPREGYNPADKDQHNPGDEDLESSARDDRVLFFGCDHENLVLASMPSLKLDSL